MSEAAERSALVRVLLGAARKLLADDFAPWAEAMRDECARTPREKAVGFAAGCLLAALRIRLAASGSTILHTLWPAPSVAEGDPVMTLHDALHRPRLIGLACGAVAVLLGAGYLAAADAPVHMLAINLGSLVIGAAIWSGLGRGENRAARGWTVLLLGVPLVATALFGVPVEGASRWVAVGPFTLQVSLLAVPAMLVLFARGPDAPGALGMVLAAGALAAQPDRGMAGALALALVVLLAAGPGRWAALAALAALTGFGWTLIAPDRLPAVPFVDRILYTAYSVHPLAGAGVLIGAALLLAPVLTALLARSGARAPLLAFGGCWSAIVAAAALGNYPTPLVGYGGAAVLGYLLSAALLPARVGFSTARVAGARADVATNGTDPGKIDARVAQTCP